MYIKNFFLLTESNKEFKNYGYRICENSEFKFWFWLLYPMNKIVFLEFFLLDLIAYNSSFNFNFDNKKTPQLNLPLSQLATLIEF